MGRLRITQTIGLKYLVGRTSRSPGDYCEQPSPPYFVQKMNLQKPAGSWIYRSTNILHVTGIEHTHPQSIHDSVAPEYLSLSLTDLATRFCDSGRQQPNEDSQQNCLTRLADNPSQSLSRFQNHAISPIPT